MIEFLGELFGELFLEYFSIYSVWLPKKELTPKKIKFFEVIFFIVECIAFFSVIIGTIILVGTKGKNMFGYCLIGLFIVYIIIYVVLKIKNKSR